MANLTARKFRRQRRDSRSTTFSRTTSIRFARRQGGPIPMDAAMPDTSRTAAGRELQAFFLNRHRTQPSGIAAAHQATFASRPTSPTNHARPSNYHGRCFKLSKHAMGHNGRDQRLAAIREPHRPILLRVRCIALFGAGAAEAETLHLTTETIVPTQRARTPARIARESRQRTEQTSTARIHPAIRTTNDRFQRLDAASALSVTPRRLAIRPIAARRRPATISI